MTTPPQLPLTVKGGSGATVTFDGWTVTIHHRGGSHGLGDASVPLPQISGVELRKAGLATAGQFSILTAGAAPPKRAGLTNRNPLSVFVNPGQTRHFQHLRDVILAALATQHAAPQQPYPPTSPSLTDELQRLGQMVQQGLLTPQEFEQAKQRLLGGAPRY